jgi:hypothetical protein
MITVCLCILLSHEHKFGVDQIEQDGQGSRDPTKVIGPRQTLEFLAEIADFDPRGNVPWDKISSTCGANM